RITAASGIYYTLNPVNPALRARANNRLRMANANEATSDKDITAQITLLIDIDPVRLSGTSATDEQKLAAQGVANEIWKELVKTHGFPEPISADSGNGYHLIYRLAESTNDSTLIKDTLKVLAEQFDTDIVKVDPTVYNPSRISKLYGTTACKGDEIPEMGIIHRQAKLLAVPDSIIPLELAKLQAFVNSATPSQNSVLTPVQTSVSTPIKAKDGQNWLDQWLTNYFPEAGEAEQWLSTPGARIWKIDCPWETAHGQKASIVQLANGAISAQCFSASCHHHNWHSLRDLKEPDWQNKMRDVQEPWSDPQPLPRQGIAPLDPILIPEPLRGFLMDISMRMQVPVDFPTVSILTVIGSLIGHKVVAFPRQYDNTWVVPANVWGLLVGPPGVKKTPALMSTLGYLQKSQKDANEQHKQDMQQFAADENVHKIKIKAAEKVLEKAINSSITTNSATKPTNNNASSVAAAQQAYDALYHKAPKKAPWKKYYTQDTTIEMLQVILQDNPNGTLVLRDEVVSLISSFEKKGHESDRGFYLEGWNGTNAYTVERLSRESVVIDQVCLSLIGTTQPGAFSKYIRGSLNNGHEADGLVPRFQLMVCPKIDRYVQHDVKPNETSQKQVNDLLEKIDHFQPNYFSDLRKKDNYIGYGFSLEAQTYFNTWEVELQNRLRDRSLPHDALGNHLAKYGSLMAKLALYFHIIDLASGYLGYSNQNFIQTENVLRGIAWCEYLETHAFAVYGVEKNGVLTDTIEKLLEKMKSGALNNSFIIWEMITKGWSGLKDTDEVKKAIEVLEQHGWVRVQHNSDTKGRPSETIQIHPRISDFNVFETKNAYPTFWLDALNQHLNPVKPEESDSLDSDDCGFDIESFTKDFNKEVLDII
ncbi:DUF3987 domain-containing protein, partial [Chromatium okenii]